MVKENIKDKYNKIKNKRNEKKDNRIEKYRANTFCAIAMVLLIVYLFFAFGVQYAGPEHGGLYSFLLVFSSISSILPVISVALITYVRTKYPHNKVGKIFMWIYIIIFIIFLISFVITLFQCSDNIPACFR